MNAKMIEGLQALSNKINHPNLTEAVYVAIEGLETPREVIESLLAIGEHQALDNTYHSHGLEALKILGASATEQAAFTASAKAGLAAYLALIEGLIKKLEIAEEDEPPEMRENRLGLIEEYAEEVAELKRGVVT